ncbi:MAG: hypothetical protein RL701_8083 [Pseudomonadota bacterium]|jgi:hypothetical protein
MQITKLIRWAVLVGACLLLLASRVAAQSTADPVGPRLSLAIGVGAGIGARSVTFSERAGDRALATQPFPTLDIALRIGMQLRRRVSLAIDSDYQTSVGLRVDNSALAPGADRRTLLRLHSVRFGVGPGYQILRARPGLSVRAFVGWMVRGLRAVGEIDLPGYMLHGPTLRPELELTLGDGSISLRGGPELALVVSASRDLEKPAGLASTGWGVGGVLAADFRLSAWLHVLLVYRGAYVRVASAWDHSFEDTEHVAVGRCELRY